MLTTAKGSEQRSYTDNGTGRSLHSLAETACYRGDYAHAQSPYRESPALHRELDATQ